MLSTLLLLAAIGASAPEAATSLPAAGAAPRPSGRLFISPMGEPFRPQPAGGDTLESWFNQADGNSDKALWAAEMQRDADRFFATLDVNRDGTIDADEMTRYEREIAPEIQVGGGGGASGQRGGGERMGRGGHGGQSGGGHGGGGRRQGGRGAQFAGEGAGQAQSGGRGNGLQGAGRFSLLNIPQPVAGADTNLNRGISADEFRRAAAERFRLLDTNHDGRLLLTELQAMRPAGGHSESRHRRGREGRSAS